MYGTRRLVGDASHDARLSESGSARCAVVPGAGIEPALAMSEIAVLPNERSRITSLRFNSLHFASLRGRPRNRTGLCRGKNSLRHLDANLPVGGTPRNRTEPCQGKSLPHLLGANVPPSCLRASRPSVCASSLLLRGARWNRTTCRWPLLYRQLGLHALVEPQKRLKPPWSPRAASDVLFGLVQLALDALLRLGDLTIEGGLYLCMRAPITLKAQNAQRRCGGFSR